MMMIEEGNCLLPGVLEEEVLLLPGFLEEEKGRRPVLEELLIPLPGERIPVKEWITA
jgi:hypothetical protein